MQTCHHMGRFLTLASKAADAGAEVKPRTVSWNAAGRCSSPIPREFVARSPCDKGASPLRWLVAERTSEPTGFARLFVDVRCRRCPQCLKARSALWRQRAISELSAVGGRTWFGTLTLSPNEHFRVKLAAQRRLQAGGDQFEALSREEQFRLRVSEINKEITKWLKRVRKNSGSRLRYICVAEAHKSGLPHFHLLVHEVYAEFPVRHSTLTEAWKFGFSKFNLVAEGEPKVAAYVTKYLTKSSLARVRASVGYGQFNTLSVGVTQWAPRVRQPPMTHQHKAITLGMETAHVGTISLSDARLSGSAEVSVFSGSPRTSGALAVPAPPPRGLRAAIAGYRLQVIEALGGSPGPAGSPADLGPQRLHPLGRGGAGGGVRARPLVDLVDLWPV